MAVTTTYPPRFLACIPLTLIQECPYPNDWLNPANFSNDPSDPGGATMCGITQTELNNDRTLQGLPPENVIDMPQDEGYGIYYNYYWLPECPVLPVGLDLCYFDTNVNQGATEATRILQFALGVTADGIIGPITEAAIKNITSVESTIRTFTARREAVYEETKNFPIFGTDWERRAQEIGTAAARAGTMQGHALAMYAKFKLTAPQ
jgi:lysozyme family protein